jgi:hypothetical protein
MVCEWLPMLGPKLRGRFVGSLAQSTAGIIEKRRSAALAALIRWPCQGQPPVRPLFAVDHCYCDLIWLFQKLTRADLNASRFAFAVAKLIGP